MASVPSLGAQSVSLPLSSQTAQAALKCSQYSASSCCAGIYLVLSYFGRLEKFAVGMQVTEKKWEFNNFYLGKTNYNFMGERKALPYPGVSFSPHIKDLLQNKQKVVLKLLTENKRSPKSFMLYSVNQPKYRGCSCTFFYTNITQLKEYCTV